MVYFVELPSGRLIVPEDEMAQAETAALTRRYEQHAEQTNDALKMIKSDVLHLRLEVGGATTRLDAVERSVNELTEEVRTGNARIIELLSNLVGKDPNTPG
ncbi:hypothetical protein [Micromonospora sp. NPDC002575]|uniref:hypothetical protein n=1 Tax=Micromonospora sp. NPDC002575 TaxID=3364222 RepID=UPI003678D3C8